MRARVLWLHHKTVQKLCRCRKEAEADGMYRVARRIHAVLLNYDGRTAPEIARILKVARSRVAEWLRNYEESGYEALLEGVRPGRPRRLSEEQTAMLCDILDSGPVAYGFLSGVWTSPMITRVIAEEFGVAYHPGHVRKLLHALGFSIQRPKRLLVRADPRKQDRWHRQTYPRIKKSPAARGGPDPRG